MKKESQNVTPVSTPTPTLNPEKFKVQATKEILFLVVQMFNEVIKNSTN